jgi:hypothetical protein
MNKLKVLSEIFTGPQSLISPYKLKKKMVFICFSIMCKCFYSLYIHSMFEYEVPFRILD